MSRQFEPIKIVGLDVEGSRPSGKGALKNIPLKLSAAVSYDWASSFNVHWRQHFYMQKRAADASGDRITVTCMEDELADGLLDELKKVVAETNQVFQAALDEAAGQEAIKTAKDAADRQALADVAKKLNFD